MLRSARSASVSSALLSAVILVAASTVTTTSAQNQNDCVSYNSSSTAGNLWDASIADPSYFGCADEGFLVAVEASYFSSINSLSWTCSGGDVIGSFSSGSVAEGSMSFTVGITEVQTRVTTGPLGFLSDMYFGGYDIDSSWNDVFFALKGPVGSNDEGAVLLPDISGSYCGDDTFATGVTVWSSGGNVLGIVLECAYVTDTCAPPNYPTGLVEDTSGPGTDPAAPSPSTIDATDTPGVSPSIVAAPDTPSSPGGTAPDLSTPIPSVNTSPTADAPSSPAGAGPVIDTPSPSVSTSSDTDEPNFSGGAGPVVETPSPSVSTTSGTDAPNSPVSTVPASDRPSTSGGTVPPTGPPSSSATTAPATDPPSSPGGGAGAVTDPPSASGGNVPATDPPSSSGGPDSAADTPSPSANSALTTRGASTSSGSTAVIAGVSAAAGLLLLAICIVASCCLYRRGERRARHPLKPWDTFGTPVLSAGRGSGGSPTPEGGGVANASEAGSSSTRGPPPTYAEPPL